ncbi:DNA-processing protein DprA [bacterium]|nr:DNA-processing protein DprA [bacterium]
MKSDTSETQELSLVHRKILLGLFLIPYFGFKKINLLFKVYQDLEKIWRLGYKDLQKNKFSNRLCGIFIHHRNQINLEQTWNLYKNYHILNYFDKNYPYFLKQSYNPPLIIFALGNLELLKNKNLLSVVGSRKFSSYGKSVIEKFIKNVAEKNITIVSGLAMGIDALAHQEALDTKGSTIAVLGSPINQIAPQTNFYLAKKIVKQGLIISEFPLGSAVRKENFPQRNKTIASLSPATLIIEAGERSGALITAKYALEENREVLTIPGSIFQKNSEGTNELIKQGAKLVNSLEDILEIYNISSNTKQSKIIFNSKNQEIIYQILENQAIHIDKIVEYSRLNTNVVIATITEMELGGLIKNIGNQTYQI